MWVKALRLSDFRSYEQVEVSLSPGVTVNVANYVACLVNMAVRSDNGSGTV